VKTLTLDPIRKTINLNGLPNGLYLIEINTPQGKQVHKVEVE